MARQYDSKRAVCEVVHVKPKIQGASKNVGKARNVDHLNKE